MAEVISVLAPNSRTFEAVRDVFRQLEITGEIHEETCGDCLTHLTHSVCSVCSVRLTHLTLNFFGNAELGIVLHALLCARRLHCRGCLHHETERNEQTPLAS